MGEPYSYEGRTAQASSILAAGGKILIIGDAAHVFDPASAIGLNTGLSDAKAVGAFYRNLHMGESEALARFVNGMKQNTRVGVRTTKHYTDWIRWAGEHDGFANLGHILVGRPTWGKKLPFMPSMIARNMFFRVAELMPRSVAEDTARKVFSTLGAPVGFHQGGPDPTRGLAIHPSTDLLR
jgi:2-polyprenyl-6-methoxyphenol hydroxylase-like FAD-dependent oxidoreductase